MSPPPVFQLDGVSVDFGGVRALTDVDLTVSEGEIVGFIGPSGAGKSTLLRLLNATVRPSRGCVRVRGRRLDQLAHRELRRLRSSIGFVHQDLHLMPNLRVSQNVEAGRLGQSGFLSSLRAMFLPPAARQREVLTLLERVGIPEKMFERTDRLSGGQRQRVAIARALYQQPTALLADEPVSSVDPARARDTMALLTSVAREEKLTLCMSLHDIELAREFVPRLIGLRDGRVVFDRARGEVDGHELGALYDLSREEMLLDGA